VSLGSKIQVVRASPQAASCSPGAIPGGEHCPVPAGLPESASAYSAVCGQLNPDAGKAANDTLAATQLRADSSDAQMGAGSMRSRATCNSLR